MSGMRDTNQFQIREVPIGDVFAGSGSLFQQHWDEIALNKNLMVLKPDREQYEAIEALGRLLVLAVFDAVGEMVGYSVTIVMPHLHYADLRVASNDVLFVSKPYRRTRLGLQLIRETEEKAKARGARLMLWHAKQGTALEALMPKLGYGVQDVVFSRGL